MHTGYLATQATLRARLKEPAPGRIQMLTGPRQVGKTTMLLDIAKTYGDQAIYVAADAPEASLPQWWLTQWNRALYQARAGRCILIIDEVHAMPNWSRLIKAAIDEVYREHLPLQMVISGSAALPLAGGARETMAGRFEHLTLRHWSARDLRETFAMSEQAAVETYVRYGAFPGSLRWITDLPRWRVYLNESIVSPAIGRDLLLLETIRKPALLRQVFAICIGHPGEIVSIQKIAGSLLEAGSFETIAHYLAMLGEAYLVAALPKYSLTEIRRKASPPKLVPLSNAFLAVSYPDEPPLPSTSPRVWGHWLENACIAYAVNAGYRVSYWREEPLEVDMVIEGDDGTWAIEVKSGEFTGYDLIGLMTFSARHRDYRPLVIGDERFKDSARKAGVSFIRWQDYLLGGLTDIA
jgi:predicted AAA+ superfamily ATPase